MVGKGIVEGIKYLAGTYHKTPGELAGETAVEAGIPAAFGGLPTAAKLMTREIGKRAPGKVASWAGVTPESKTIAQGLERWGVTPPIPSVAPGMKFLEYDRRLRNQLMKDPYAEGRAVAVDSHMKEILQRFGVRDTDLSLQQIKNTAAKFSASEAAEPALQRMTREERELQTVAREHFDEAKRLLTAEWERYRTSFSDKSGERFGKGGTKERQIGELGEDFGKAYTQAEQGFRQHFDRMYGAIDEMAGGHRYVDMSGAPNNTLKLIGDIFKNQGREVPDLTQPLTYQEAHTIRSVLRDQAHMDEVSPTGVNRTSNLRYVQGQVDSAIRNTEDVVGKEVAGALRETDKQFSEQVKTFTNSKIKNMVAEIRQGRSPDPEVVANTILDSNSAAAAKQIWDILPQSLQVRTQTAFMKSIFDDSTVYGRDGKATLDPMKLIKRLDDTKQLQPLIEEGKAFWSNLRTMANNFRALNEDVDVTALADVARGNPTGTAIRQHLEQQLGALQALHSQANRDPIGALRSDNPTLNRMGARYFLQSEADTRAGAERLGVNSPEWQAVQRYAVQDAFKSAIRVKKGVGTTVYGKGLETELGNLTDYQQRVLFGDTNIADIRLLAKEARALFPEMEEDFGASLKAAEIKGGALEGKRGLLRTVRGYTVSMLAGWIADHPALVRALTGTIRQDPIKGRALMSWILQEGADAGYQYQGQSPEGQQTPDPMKQMPQFGPVPKQKPEPIRPNLYQ